MHTHTNTPLRFLQSLQSSSYNHFSAIYYLLLERVKEHRSQHLSRQCGGTWTQRSRSMSDSSSSPEVSVSSQSLSLPPPGVTLHPSGSLRSSSAPSPPQGDGGVVRQFPPSPACRHADEQRNAFTDGVGSGRSVSGKCFIAVFVHYSLSQCMLLKSSIFFFRLVSSGWCVRWRRVSMVSCGIAPSLLTVSWRPPSTKKYVPETWRKRTERCKPLRQNSQTPPHVDTPSPKSPPAFTSAALPVSSTKLFIKKKNSGSDLPSEA